MEIGQQVFIPVGDEGHGIWGTISYIISDETPLYFVEGLNGGFLEKEMKFRPRYEMNILLGNITEADNACNGGSERFGQAFYNRFDQSGIPFPQLFYETSRKKAIELIFENYLAE